MTTLDTQLIKNTHNQTNLTEMKAQAELLIKSGFLPREIKTAEQAVVIMLTGRELDMSPMQAFRSIYVIHGKPTLSANLMLALCENTKQLENKRIEEGDGWCQVTLKRKGQDPYTVKYTREDADRAKFSMSYDEQKKGYVVKDNWEKQPKTMLLWRAISAACRVVFPDATIGLYTPDELGASVDVSPSGEIVEVHEPPAIEEQAPADTKAPEQKPDDIPGDQLPNYVLKSGQYKDMTLSQVLGQQTDTGRSKGLDYLQWMVSDDAQRVDPKLKEIVRRFLKLMDLI